MKVLVTGSRGYIGTYLTKYLSENDLNIVGTDVGYFTDCNLLPIENEVLTIKKDIRDFETEDLTGFDAIVHLAALSNDPVGELDESITFDINYNATMNLAKQAKSQGIKKFIFISTQSIYGISKSEEELDENNSIKNPQTAYAKSKWKAEQDLKSLEDKSFEITYIRPSTVFGWSPRLRSDIVFNNLLLNGLKFNQIEVHSDGSPWRPIVHIDDLSRFILIILKSSSKKTAGEAFNIGVLGGNYTVKEIAVAAQQCLSNKPVIVYNTEEITDPRSYKVSFQKAKNVLNYEAEITMQTGGAEIISKISNIPSLDSDQLFEKTNRLNQLKKLINEGKLDENLRYV
jgi:nucleoside-diphosphate-sugar epimerase